MRRPLNSLSKFLIVHPEHTWASTPEHQSFSLLSQRLTLVTRLSKSSENPLSAGVSDFCRNLPDVRYSLLRIGISWIKEDSATTAASWVRSSLDSFKASVPALLGSHTRTPWVQVHRAFVYYQVSQHCLPRTHGTLPFLSPNSKAAYLRLRFDGNSDTNMSHSRRKCCFSFPVMEAPSYQCV